MKHGLLIIPLLILIFISGCTQTGYVVSNNNLTNETSTTGTVIETEQTTTTIKQCPDCDDNDPCTEEKCSAETDYECTYRLLDACNVSETNETSLLINVTITAIHYETPEWVEIQNNGDTVNLTGWTLRDNSSHVYTFDAFILASGASVKLYTGTGTDSPDLYWGYSSSVWNNEGDSALLKDNEGNIIDEYSYKPEETTTTTISTTTTSTSTSTTATTTTTSTITSTTIKTTTTTTTSATLQTTTTTIASSSTTTSITTTSSTTTTLQAIGHIVISEVYYDAEGDDATREWLELYNPTAEAVNLGEYKINDNQYTWNLPDTAMPANAYITIARNADGFYELYSCYPGIEGMTLMLSNAGDFVNLTKTGQEIDFVAWENFVEGWDISASTGKSIIRSGYDTGTDSDWLSEQTPTPQCA